MNGRTFKCMIGIGSLTLVSLMSLTTLAWGEYPERPIRLIIGFAAGGTGDLPGRTLSDAAAKILKQPIVVENMLGATGTKASAFVSSATPDGYTLGHQNTTGITEKPHVMSVSYDPLKGFTPIMLFGWYTYAATVRKEAPWKNFKELVEYGRANPGKIKYGTAGFKSTAHLFGERLQMVVPGLKMVPIPFNGDFQAITALLGGHIDVHLGTGVTSHIISGELRMLAALNNKRWKSFPDIPTVQELGYPVACENAQGIFAPPGLPEPIRMKLQEAFREAMKDEVFIKTMERLDLIIDYMPGAKVEAFLKERFEMNREMVKGLSK